MIELRTLGTVDLRREGMTLSTVLAQPKRLAVLAYLASARPRGFVSRETLLALFWPEADTERARNSLRQALHQLRRALGDEAIPGRGDREVGIDHALVRCDAAEFDDLIEAGAWEEALRRYGGDFLPGLFVQDAPEAERWLEDERARRKREAVGAAWKLAEAAEGAGDAVEAKRCARRAVALDPADEGGLRKLMALLVRVGDAAGAIAAFDEFARRLRQDYELEPSRESVAAVAAIRGGTSAPSTAAVAERSVAATYAPPAAAPNPAPAAPPLPAAPPAPLALPRRGHRVWRVRALVAATLMIVAALVAWSAFRGRGAAAPEAAEPSIAVLPFMNLSGDAANDYFSDGISEELLNLLAQVPGLQVAARTSSFAFKGKQVTVDSIGRALRVRHVLEGSVRQSGDSVRITAQLIDARTDKHLWSGNFNRRFADVIEVQDSIGRAIVDALRPRLTRVAALQEREPRDPEAHVAVLKGWRTFRINSREAWASAAELFSEAIRLDPKYGRAYAGLATVRNWQSAQRYIPADSGYAEARRLATRALALDSTLSEAHVILGYISDAVDLDYASADEHYLAAMRANPSDARAYSRRAQMMARLGRGDEAIASAKRAVQLDPASPAVYADLGAVYMTLNRWRDAEQSFRSALALDPGHPILSQNLANVLAELGRYAEAAQVIEQGRRRAPDDVRAMGLQAYVLARAGRTEQARVLVDSATRAGLPLVSQASVHATLGDTTKAWSLIERALREGDDDLNMLLDSTAFPALERDARMKRIRAEVRGMQLETKR